MAKIIEKLKNIPLIKNGLRWYRYRNYKVGRWTYGVPEVVSWDQGTKLEIGSFCSISKGVKILLGGEHRTDWISTFPFNLLWEEAKDIPGHPSTKGDVIIENDVWIGTDSIILSGIRIGNGSVVGARSVVTKDVPPYAIVAGNPAKVIRYRFEERVIEELLKIRWWEWEDEKIARFIPELLSDNINVFIEKARNIT